MGEGNPLVNVGELAKPATLLIKKISDGIGGAFKPFQIKRVAKAEAEAALVKAQSEIQVTELQRRALHRFIEEEAKKQDNMEGITAKALPLIADEARPEEIDDDWISNFFDKCRIVSDSEMQQLWAKVLAGEANSPGSYSKRSVNFLSSLDKHDAILFSKLCGFAWVIGQVVPLVYDLQAPIYASRGINFNALTHLDDIGLISFSDLAGYMRQGFPRSACIFYYGEPTIIEFPNETNNAIELGHVLLTQTGLQLAPICGSQPIPEFRHFVLERLSKLNLTVSSPFPHISANGKDVHDAVYE